MKIQTNRVLTNLEGSENLKENDKEVTLGQVLVGALMNPREELGPEKAEKFELAIRIKMAVKDAHEDAVPYVEVSAEEIVLLKECIGYGFTPLVVGQVYRILEDK